MQNCKKGTMSDTWHGYSILKVLAYASNASGLRTAQAIEDSLAHIAAVIRNDYRKQPLEVLRECKYRIFQGRTKPDSILIDGVPNRNNPFPNENQEYIIKDQFTKHVNAIKCNSKESSDPPTKEELKHDKKNNKFSLGHMQLSYQLEKKQRLEEHEYLNDFLYTQLAGNLVQTLLDLAVGLNYFRRNMDEEDEYRRVVLFKKHNEIFDKILIRVKTILKYSRKLKRKFELD